MTAEKKYRNELRSIEGYRVTRREARSAKRLRDKTVKWLKDEQMVINSILAHRG